MSKALRDKLFWRKIEHQYPWHCYEKVGPCRWESLCGDRKISGRIGGQDARRPIAMLRCAECDTEEMKMRGWTESGPDSMSETAGRATPRGGA